MNIPHSTIEPFGYLGIPKFYNLSEKLEKSLDGSLERLFKHLKENADAEHIRKRLIWAAVSNGATNVDVSYEYLRVRRITVFYITCDLLDRRILRFFNYPH